MTSEPSGLAELIEVAVSLPVSGTFTYRHRGETLRIGVQVVVPFANRTVTGFVVGPAPSAPARVRDIVEVLRDAPVVDPDVMQLCRFASRYYLAPFGEVLRAALPQGQRVAARRRVRLSPEGMAILDSDWQKADLRIASLGPEDRALLQRLGKTASLSLRGVGGDGANRKQIQRLVELNLLEVGDEIGTAHREPTERFVSLTAQGASAKLKGPVQLAVVARLREFPDGLAVAQLEDRERAIVPSLVRKGLVQVAERKLESLPPTRSPGLPPMLNPQQSEAHDAIIEACGNGYAGFLLHGITGSGKTEVYLRTIAHVRGLGQGALVLVPEIALTPQLASRFRDRFGDDVAVLHSALPRSERLNAWRRLSNGEVGIALGARSAVFAPVQRLGLIVVDEEHDPSFKQDEGVRYHGRDLALVRAQSCRAVAVLGSATPSLESCHNRDTGKLRYLSLPMRAAPGAADRPLPQVQILDLRQRPAGPDGLFSPLLAEAMRQTVAAGDQVILFLNRRGFSTVLLCRACGLVLQCKDCDVSMTLHRSLGRVVCHYCGKNAPPPVRCSRCRESKMDSLGTGTERVQSVVQSMLPGARVVRLDRDTAGPDVASSAAKSGGDSESADGFSAEARGLENILAQMHAGKIDVLVGTQMVTKGHDFPGVTLVGILQPDQGMNLPDFRAAERTFQLLEQVAGRAGRSHRPGRVIVQTYNPNHPAITSLVTHDFDGFVKQELERRKEANYPPYFRFVVVRVDAATEGLAREAATALAVELRALGRGSGVRVLGPAEAPIPRLRNRYRFQIWLSHPSRAPLLTVLTAAMDSRQLKVPAGVRMAVDVDPQSVL
ncbi:MAG: primosomal protein N' [Deltaproteobacteria bacterium]|nr:primosomal protein N' [Deltaproteobacteria bacterium]